jgi:hypothetical protein
MSRDNKSASEPSWISREDLQDIAKIGGDLLKRTVSSSIDVLKDVTDTIPKDASQIISKSRDEVMKGFSKEFAQNLVSLTVDKVFSAVRDHRLDISIRVRKAGEPVGGETPTRAGEFEQNQKNQNRTNQPKQAHKEEQQQQERNASKNIGQSRRHSKGRHRP